MRTACALVTCTTVMFAVGAGAEIPQDPSPSAGKVAALAAAVEDHMASFASPCFGPTVTLGDETKFRSALAPAELTIEDGTPRAISTLGKRGSSGALADQSDMFGGPMQNVLFLPFALPTGPGAKALTKAQKATLWHEVTHQIEALHGDRQTADYAKHIAYRERNAAYLGAAVIALQDLADIEKHMRAKNQDETDQDWEEWKVLNGRPELARIAARFRALEQGVATEEALKDKFNSGDRRRWPPDLKQLQGWTGIKVQFSDVLNHYASGECGDELKALALKELELDIAELMRQHKELQARLVALSPFQEAEAAVIRAEQKAIYQDVMRRKGELAKRK